MCRNQRDNQERRQTSTIVNETHGNEGPKYTPEKINVNEKLPTAENAQQKIHETVEAEVQVVEEVRRPNVHLDTGKKFKS